MIRRVFISYRRTLLDRVEPLVAAFRRAGIECFLDRDAIDPLAPFPEVIRQGIDDSHVLLAVWSAAYGDSDHCLAEFKLAWQHARRHNPDVGKRIWVLNPEPTADHITAGELDASNFLALPAPGTEDAWAAALADRMRDTLPDSPLADEHDALPEPMHRNLPTPTDEFTGRNAEMFRIHSRLHPARIGAAGGAVAVQTHGLGGVGKTELAAKYAHDFAQAYPGGIVWLNLASYLPGEAAKTDEAEAAWLLAIEQCWRGDEALFADAGGTPPPPEMVRHRLGERLGAAGPYLWILDNVPVLKPEDSRESILAFWRAPTAGGATLITTRDARPAPGIASERLDVLGDEDALRLLARYRTIGESGRAAAEALVAEVGAHTQALALLGERLRDGINGYEETLARLQTEGRLERIEAIAAALKGELGEKARGIVATFAVSIGEQAAAAQALLRIAAECAPNEPIPLGLLQAATGAADDADGFDAALGALVRASLLTRRRDGDGPGQPVEIHPLLADVTRQLVAPDDDAPGETISTALLKILVAAGDVRRRDALAPMIVHARQLAFGQETGQAVHLALRIGQYEAARGIYPLARTAEERAQEVSRRTLGEEHPSTLASMNNLASTIRAQGELPAARALEEQVLEIRRRVLGEEHPDTLTSMNNLASTIGAQGDLPAARALQEQVLEIIGRVLGEEHPDTLTSMNNLAGTIGAQGELPAARALHEQVLEIRRRVLGEEHPDTLTSMNNLAGTIRAQGELPAARALHEQELAICRRVLGEEHPDTLTSMVNLAATLWEQGDHPAARALEEKALEIRRRTLGEEHPSTLISAWNLLGTLLRIGDVEGCRALLTETALGRLPEIPDERLIGDLIPLKPQIAELRAKFGL